MSVLGAQCGPGFHFSIWSLKPISGGPAEFAMTTVCQRQYPSILDEINQIFFIQMVQDPGERIYRSRRVQSQGAQETKRNIGPVNCEGVVMPVFSRTNSNSC